MDFEKYNKIVDEYFEKITPDEVVALFEGIGYDFSQEEPNDKLLEEEHVLNSDGIFSEAIKVPVSDIGIKSYPNYVMKAAGGIYYAAFFSNFEEDENPSTFHAISA
jgi:hypothetical protein